MGGCGYEGNGSGDVAPPSAKSAQPWRSEKTPGRAGGFLVSSPMGIQMGKNAEIAQIGLRGHGEFPQGEQQ